MPALSPSTKEQIVLTAEQLFGQRGIDGVSLRQISAAAGNSNNSAVQYHFGSKDQLIQATFEYRLPRLLERRRLLVAARHTHDLRSLVECQLLTVMEQSEQSASYYLSFVSMLRQHGRHEVFERLPDELKEPTRDFHDRLGALLGHIAEPLRTHRQGQAMEFVVQAAADRERARTHGWTVLPFAVEANDLLDGIVGFLAAPVSQAAYDALGLAASSGRTWLPFP